MDAHGMKAHVRLPPYKGTLTASVMLTKMGVHGIAGLLFMPFWEVA
eukprot:jgi/Astpho2/5734/gw1.00080.199.1_t